MHAPDHSLSRAALFNSAHLKSISAILLALASLFLLSPAAAAAPGFQLSLSVTHGYDIYFPGISLDADPAPDTYHRIESPTGLFWRNIGTNNDSHPFFYTNNLPFIVSEFTNGLWKLYLNKESGSETVFYFKVSTPGVTPGVFGDIDILYPADQSMDIPPQPEFHWTGPSNMPNLYIDAQNENSSNFNWDSPPSATTNWLFPGTLSGGDAQFYVTYSDPHFSGMIISTPTNALGQPVSDWTARGEVSTYAFSFFSVLGVSGQTGHTNAAHYEFEDNTIFTADLSPAGNYINSSGRTGGGTNMITTDSLSGIRAIQFDNNNGAGGAWIRPRTNLVSALAGSFTVSLWLKTTQTSGDDDDSGISGNAGIVSAFTGPTAHWVIPMALTGSKVAFVTGGNTIQTLHSSESVNTGDFVHIAVTRDLSSGAKRIYINGQLDTEGSGTTDLLEGPTEVRIGYNNGTGLDGILDDIQFYSGVLDDSEILFLYENPGSTVPDVAGDSLPEAVDAPQLPWTTGGDAPWFAQTAETHDGTDAGRSGAIGDDESSWAQTTVQGPGMLTFWWRTSSDNGASYDSLEFTMDGNYEDDIAGDSGWLYREFQIPGGQHTVRWTYYKDFELSDGLDAAFLDEVNFIPGSEPVITRNPGSQTNYPGYDVGLVAEAAGLPEPMWQWYKAGSGAIPGANSSSYFPTNAGTPQVAGSYYAIATNDLGSAITVTAVVSFVSAPLPPDWTRARKIEWLTENDFFYSCFPDASGSLYIAGEFTGTNLYNSSTLIAGPGGSAAIIIKADSTGSPLWARGLTNNGAGSSRAYVTAPAPGGAYLAGNFSGTNWFGTTQLTSAGESDIFIARFDSAGGLAWAKTIGGTQNDFVLINSLASDTSGDLYLCGLLSGSASFAGVTNLNATGQQGFLVKFDSDGTPAWVQITTNTFLQYLAHSDGVLYVSTENGSSPPHVGGQAISSDRRWAIAAVNAATGQAIWMQGVAAIQGASNPLGLIDDVPRIAVSGTNLFLVGNAYTNSVKFGAFTLPLSNNRAQYFARLDTNGTFHAASEFGSPTTTPLAAVADATGNVYVSGDFETVSHFGSALLAAPANETMNPAVFSQAFLAKFDRNGTPLWARKGQSDAGYANFRGISLATDGVWAVGFCKNETRYGTNTVYSNVECIGFPFCTLVYSTSGVIAKITDGVSPALPVQLVNILRSGPMLQFSFQSQSGRSHNIQSRTNLVLGAWQSRSNLSGDGTLKTVQFPATNATEFFRVETP